MARKKIRMEYEFEIPEDADLSVLEEIAGRASREAVFRAFLREKEKEAEETPCPGCGKKGQSETG